MSDFQSKEINPLTGKEETVTYIDDYFGRHRYGIKFSDGRIYEEARLIELNKKQFNENK